MPMPRSFGERLASLRAKNGLTQVELARQAGVHIATLNALEHGRRSGEKVAVEIAKKLARTLGVTLDQLTGMYEEEPR